MQENAPTTTRNRQAGTPVTDDIVTRVVTNDIVTRLRLLSASQKAHRFGDLLDDWSGEAADEIERLRKERIRWERIAHDLYRRVDVYGEVCSCNDYDKHWCGLHAYEDEIRGLQERGSA